MRLQGENRKNLERVLLAKVAGGDHLAFKELYNKHYDKVYKFAFKIMGVKEASEEILQETMLYVWQQRSKLINIPNFEGYLKTIAKHKAIDTFRRKVLAEKAEKLLRAEYNDTYAMNEEWTVLSAARDALEEGIKQLPAQQRQVYQLCYQEGLKYDQVAEKLQISHGTVQTHMKLALKFLRNYIQNHSDIAALIIIFKLL